MKPKPYTCSRCPKPAPKPTGVDPFPLCADCRAKRAREDAQDRRIARKFEGAAAATASLF